MESFNKKAKQMSLKKDAAAAQNARRQPALSSGAAPAPGWHGNSGSAYTAVARTAARLPDLAQSEARDEGTAPTLPRTCT